MLALAAWVTAASRGFGGDLPAEDPFAEHARRLEEQLSEMAQTAALRPAGPAAEMTPNESPAKAPLEYPLPEFRNLPALARLSAIRPALERILDEEGLPRELVAVVLIESGAQPFALSPKQARGLWQLIPATARQYGLRVEQKLDERVHLEHATRAAARFLKDLHARFGDWELSLAAYNAGPAAIERAMERSKTRTFSDLAASGRLPEETREYVPAVLAAMRLLGGSQLPVAPARTQTAPVFAPFAVSGS